MYHGSASRALYPPPRPIARAYPLRALQHSHREVLCLLGALLHQISPPAASEGDGAAEVQAFLSFLANDRKVAPSTHRQALAAILYLYKEVLNIQLPWMDEIGRPKQRVHIPVVLSRAEVAALLGALDERHLLICQLLYGAGLRLMECLSLRVKDLDFDRRTIIVRHGKGAKDRCARTKVSTRRRELVVALALPGSESFDRSSHRPPSPASSI